MMSYGDGGGGGAAAAAAGGDGMGPPPQPPAAFDAGSTRQLAIRRSQVRGVGFGMELRDAIVTGYRGQFGPAERAGVQIGWSAPPRPAPPPAG
eukprot:COSAG01_NODE_1871_length_9009_cov_5.036139_9_plen_93_part_00